MAILQKLRHKLPSEVRPYKGIAEKLAADPRFKKLMTMKYVVNRKYDIPYLSGYSEDGKTIYLDRKFKPIMKDGTDVTQFLVVRERAEKTALSMLKLRYADAHKIAAYLEYKAVTSAGIDWKAYSDFLYPYIRKTDRMSIRKIPKNLDLRPYTAEHDVKHLIAMKKIAKGPEVEPEQNKQVTEEIQPIQSTETFE